MCRVFLLNEPSNPLTLFLISTLTVSNSYAPFDHWFGSFAKDEADFQLLQERRIKSYGGVKKVD